MAGKSYSHQLDAKNRMRIPSKFREELGDSYTISIGAGGCLNVYTKEQMKELKATLANVNPFREKQLQAARYILYYSWEAEEDNQGRILIPENLRKYAKIEKNITIFKGPNCIEIWSDEVFGQYFGNVSFDNLADALDAMKNND